jgi:uncharacterized protein YdeI (YjbR/CyaY-like superfamily)
MSASHFHPQVDAFIQSSGHWQELFVRLRNIALTSGLSEEWKWRQPCYTYQGNNVIILASLKDCCTLGFFKGALLQDTHQLLHKPGENTQSARTIRFTTAEQIDVLEQVLKSYIAQAIEVEKAGLKVEFQKADSIEWPAELQQIFVGDELYRVAFTSLTPGRQRAYLLFFAAAKQAKTRVDRIEKYRQQIINGFGMNDCTCGLSKRMPGCDGSHKTLRA